MLITPGTTIKYINKNGQSIDLSPTTEFWLERFEEDVPNELTTVPQSYIDGDMFIHGRLKPREMTLTGFFKNSVARYYDHDYIKQLREHFIRILNPKIAGKLIYYKKGKYVMEQMTLPVQFASVPILAWDHFGGRMTFTIELIATNPFWQGGTITENISDVISKMYYPRAYPQKERDWNEYENKLVHGFQRTSHHIVINNIGDAKSGFTLTLTAGTGTVKNPSLLHENSGYFFNFIIDMNKGDRITVNSRPQEKNVFVKRFDQEEVLDFSILTPDSEFFMLDVGKNTFYYDAEQNLLNLQGKLLYNPYYVAV